MVTVGRIFIDEGGSVWKWFCELCGIQIKFFAVAAVVPRVCASYLENNPTSLTVAVPVFKGYRTVMTDDGSSSAKGRPRIPGLDPIRRE